jgi:ParB family chromosome partitioning protein
MFNKKTDNKPKALPEEIIRPLEAAPPPIEYKIISLDLIDDPERPIRKDLTPESVADLVMSIKQMGIIEPLIVFSKGDRYEVIAGHRRRYAAELAKLAEAPCHVHKVSPEQIEMMKIHENMYRQNIRPSDEMIHFKYIMTRLKISPTKLAQLIGKSDGYVSERLGIADYEPELKEALDTGKINFSVAKELAKTDDRNKTIEYLRYAIQNGLTQTGARQWVQDYKNSLLTPKQTPVTTYDPATNTVLQKIYYPCIRRTKSLIRP